MKIELNKQLETEVYIAFREAVVGGADFGKKIRDDHPNITKENYTQYIDDFYVTHDDELEGVLKDTESCFDEVKDPLFAELQKYFGNDYSKENYTCYLSIFDCNPRYLETKSFQVYYKRSHDMRKEVIVHELTHFAFYDFCHELGIKDSDALWELSEIFNVIFLNVISIQKAIGAEELLFYPDLENKLEEIKQIWANQLDARDFIMASLQYLQIKPKDIQIEGKSFVFVKDQRDKKSSIYKSDDTYLRIGNPEKISADLAFHKQMETQEFPVAKVISEGELDGQAYFIESSLGEKHFGEIFAEDVEKSGSISQESFKQFLKIVEQFAKAQLRTQSEVRDFSEFAKGIHLDVLCEELPEYATKIRAIFETIKQKLSVLPFVITHGDFNPHNLYPAGVIDFEDSFNGPFGYDLVGALTRIDYYPDSADFEFFAKYRFSEDQSINILKHLTAFVPSQIFLHFPDLKTSLSSVGPCGY